MTTDYHNPINTNAPGNASVFNAPLGQLDNAIGGVLNGSSLFSKIAFNNPTTLTISSGSITPTLGVHLVAAQTGNSDDLDTITASNGSLLLIKADSGDVIRIRNVGNIDIESNVLLYDNKVALLYCQNSQWSLVNSILSEKLSSHLYASGFEIESFDGSNTVVIQPGECLNDAGTYVISNKTATITLNLNNTGVNGIDNGSVANNTWYYVWLCAGNSGVCSVASTSPTSPVMPTGYDSYKRRIASVKTNGSAAVYPCYMPRGQFLSRRVYYTEVTNASPYQILNEANIGQTGSRTTVDCSALVPVTSRTVIALIEINTPGGTANVFWSSNGLSDTYLMNLAGTGMISSTVYDLEVLWQFGTAQIYSSAAVDEDLSFYILGYIDDGLGYLAYTP